MCSPPSRTACQGLIVTFFRLAVEQKKTDQLKETGIIDYDAPTETKEKTIGLGAKVKYFLVHLIFIILLLLAAHCHLTVRFSHEIDRSRSSCSGLRLGICPWRLSSL